MSGTLYGYIHCFDPSPAAEAHNRAVLQSLPVTGAQITRALFSVLPNSRGHCYYGHMMHFATYPKGSYIFDDSWLDEYEALLERLFWDNSEVVHTYCGERRTWDSSKTHGLAQPTGLKISNRKVFPSYHDLEPIEDSDAPTPGNS
ncbi:hypothetical protein [Pseudomonas protegens]|uniref:hypothetical protein n=1 Tax=Pseudomonas protegens TaxID=380021 RepID=UPI00383B47B4